MGTHGYGTVTQLLRGSVSHEAIPYDGSRIPVTLVKSAVEAPLGKRPSQIDAAAVSHHPATE